MKKISILGLIASLFVVFALSSCSKDDEAKKDEQLAFVGKTYKVLTTWETELIEDESTMKDDDTRRYFIFTFDNENELTYKHGTYTPADKSSNDGELNGNTIVKYRYQLVLGTKTIQLQEILSVKTDIEKQGIDPLEEQKQNAERFMKKISLEFDEKFEVLTITGTDKKGETQSLPLKLQK